MLQETGLLDEGSLVVAEHLYDNKLSDTYGFCMGLKKRDTAALVSTYIFMKIRAMKHFEFLIISLAFANI